MSDRAAPDQGVMEGGGAYNRHSILQAAGIATALPLLERAVLNLALEADSHPIVIADYGSSEGKNSLAPMRLVIETIRRRTDPKRPILVFHVDQPGNDFNSLFTLLNTDQASYGLEPNVFSSAVGRSFYESVLPAGHVHLGWSSYAAHWLSKVPTTIPDHFHSTFSSGAVLAEFDRQAALDWKAFLSLRAKELRSGGHLLVVLPALDDDGRVGLEDLYNHANGVLAEMVDAGAIKAEERARMVLGSHLRCRGDLLAPFEQEGEFQQLIVEDCELSRISDFAWTDYERDQNKEIWASRHARFFRSTFASSLMLGLTNAGDAGQRRAFADQLEERLQVRLMSHPAPMRSFVTTIVLARR
jgi:SAM dependent carboxyl methyltransferase